MPTKHSFRTAKGKLLAVCVLANLLMREVQTRSVLADLLAAEGKEVNLPDSRDFTENAELSMSPVTSRILNPQHYPADSALNAFMKLVTSSRIRVLPVEFMVFLIAKKLNKLLAWTKHNSGIDEKTEGIVIPMHDSLIHHWALAFVRRESKEIEIIDSLPGIRDWVCIFPRLLSWANRLSHVYGSTWSCLHKIMERTDGSMTTFDGIDASIIMCYHAYTLSQK